MRQPAFWDAEPAIRAVLQPGEVLLWLGRPAPPDRPLPLGWPEAFSLAIARIAVLVVVTRLLEPEPFGLQDIGRGTILLLLTAYVAAPGWSLRPRSLWKRRVAYAVTNYRALILRQDGGRTHLDAYGPAQIALVSRRDRGDGLQDVVFREGPRLGQTRPWNPIGFIGINDADGAVRHLFALRHRRPGTGRPSRRRAPEPPRRGHVATRHSRTKSSNSSRFTSDTAQNTISPSVQRTRL